MNSTNESKRTTEESAEVCERGKETVGHFFLPMMHMSPQVFVNILVHKVKYYLHNVFRNNKHDKQRGDLNVKKQAFNSDLHHPQNKVYQQTALL